MTNFTVEIRNLLEEYNKEVAEVVKECAKETAQKCARQLKASSPRGARGRYAKGWSVKKEGDGFIVHNKTDYQLTHLLENGHVIANGSGTYGRTRGIKHIEPVEREMVTEFERTVRERLEK